MTSEQQRRLVISASGRVTRAAAWTLPLLLAVSLCAGQDSKIDDPLPLRRVYIPVGRIPLERERVRQGALVQLPREEFETKVQKAAKARQAAKKAPRLAKATYAAEFDGQALVNGRGQWNIVNPNQAPALFSLPEFNLALSDLNRPGSVKDDPPLLGELDGKNLSLLVESAGAQEYSFNWSLRGQPGPNGQEFDLRLPPSPIASLELKVPADYHVLVPDGQAMLLPPGESEKKNARRTWRLSFSTRSQVALAFRKVSGS